ncbi:MAG: hypothetical protein PHV49_00670 [Alistipes sp.]|nr:hypothetical protein [Alistipes sp.]
MIHTPKRILLAILLLMCSVAHGQRFDRGIHKQVFVPKGQWLTGGNFSYAELGMEDYKFLILDDMKGDGYSLSVSPFLGYFVGNNTAIGVRFAYQRSLVRVNNVNLGLGDDLSFEIKDYYNLQHVYYGTLMMRNYINIGNSKRFGLFNEVRLTAGGGQGKSLSGRGETLSGTYQEVYEFQIGLAPGLAAFITNEVAIEASIGVLGFKYKKVNQLTDQTYKGSYTTSSASFKINIFSVSLGVAFYLPTINPHVGRRVGNMFRDKDHRKE